MYSLIVYFLISCISIIYSFHLFINYLRIYYLLYYSFIRIYYSVYYSFILILLFSILFIYTYFTIHLYVFYYSFIRIYYSLIRIYYLLIHILLFTINYSLFTIYHLLFNIYYLLLTICYLGKNPYLMEFDETPKFWCSRVARDAWVNLTFCSDQF